METYKNIQNLFIPLNEFCNSWLLQGTDMKWVNPCLCLALDTIESILLQAIATANFESPLIWISSFSTPCFGIFNQARVSDSILFFVVPFLPISIGKKALATWKDAWNMKPNEQFESTRVHLQEKISNLQVNEHFESGLILSWNNILKKCCFTLN